MYIHLRDNQLMPKIQCKILRKLIETIYKKI